jgi:hypothetical protein
MKTDYAGIDYSLGQANVDEKGYHFGVVSQHEVLQAWADSSEAEYGKPLCPDCFNDLDETSEYSVNDKPVFDEKGNEIEDEYYCSVCDKGVDENDPDIWSDEPLNFYYNEDGYQAEQTYGDTDIFITKSPYYTWAQYCSPCAPGAGYLMSWMDKGNGIKTYCFGHDWFENEKAPYPVYRVDNDEEVKV